MVAWTREVRKSENLLYFTTEIENSPSSQRKNSICLIRLKGKWYNNYSLVSVHAPTEEKDEHVKQFFYNLLERLLNTIPKQDITLILRD